MTSPILTLPFIALLLLPSAASAGETLTAPAKPFLAIEEVKSPGGLTAWLVEDHTLPIVSLTFLFNDAGSARDPRDRQGLARMVSNTLDEGAGDLDSQAFQKALSDHSISLSFSASRDDLAGSLKTLTRHQDKAFDLLRLALTQPRFDAEAIERMRAANISRIRSSMTEPEWIAARLLNDLSYGDHPYALNSGGTITSLNAITRDDLAGFVKNNLSRDRLLIGVTGDITPGKLAITLDQVFSTLPAASTAQTLTDAGIGHLGQTYLYKKDIPQSIIQMVQPGLDFKDPDYYAAYVMNHILGASGFGSRLTEEIREKRGLTYGIYSSIFDMDHAHGFTIGLSTENKNAAEALRLIRAEIRKMQDHPVSAQELADAQSYIVGALPLSFSSTAAISANVLGLRQDNWPMDYYDHFPSRIRAVTAADIQRVAKRILTPDNMLTVIVGQPEGVDAETLPPALPNVE
ncbi:MAG: insulinase family protein [Micavibrio aeruginosavorus]|uniref:Insulinase family protein n=1 Tax=Micavibrio aeruginosavorus TaxID=349221 RepID=A0A7T5R265_9BACT|nr:MAG: insulinase family protein [Micavibrio aeruginosavorus]